MKTHILSVLLLITTLFNGWTQDAGQATGFKPYLYKLQLGASEGYLLGTMHMGRPSYWNLSPEIHQALDQSGILYLEVSPADQAKVDLAALLGEFFPLEANFDLQKALGSEDWNRLKAFFPIVDDESLKALHPLMLSMTIELQGYIKRGLAPGYGIDFLLTQESYKRQIPIASLEIAETQIRALGTLYKDSVSGLQETLQNISKSEMYVAQTIEAFESGTDQKMIDLVSTIKSDDQDFWEAMVLQRNNTQANGILAALMNGEIPFAAVGVAHLFGDGSVIDLLRKNGVSVRRITP